MTDTGIDDGEIYDDVDILTIYGEAGGSLEAFCWKIYNLRMIDPCLFEEIVLKIEKFSPELARYTRLGFIRWKRNDQQIFQLISASDLKQSVLELVDKIREIEMMKRSGKLTD